VAVGAVTAVLALLALTAMHALPMGMGHSDAVAGDATAGSVGTPATGLMHAGHVDGMVMSGVLATANTAAGTVPATAAGAKHSTGGVPPHGHSLLHLCVAVLVVGLSLALAAGLRRRLWGSVLLTRMVPVRAALTRDTGPPSLAGLCLLRC